MKGKLDLDLIEFELLMCDPDTVLRLLRQACTRLAVIEGRNECSVLAHMIGIDIACRELLQEMDGVTL